jgi:uncharacterized MAPEG superfamily protein
MKWDRIWAPKGEFNWLYPRIGSTLLASIYFGSRVAHMFCYYLNFKIARSVVFAVTALSLVGLFVVGLMAF